ncbi:hypothetical protein [Microlunatus speluncae]|uniref:hypothetical protein n=1 Tax=Microlunatus speluncae TaxID=2594267 RepID=UPI00126685BB|nr:hypothetical protein [Microlunatus speluncae]
MRTETLSANLNLVVGTMSRLQLLQSLNHEDVGLNPSAETLLDNPIFDEIKPQTIAVTERTVGELGLPTGAPLPQILQAAQQQGLHLCPPTTGPYLRLAWLSQPNAPDTVMSNGRAPSGSVTVAAAPLSQDAAYPKGFYLRVIDRRLWLRGFRCDDLHPWSPDDRFVFTMATPSTAR